MLNLRRALYAFFSKSVYEKSLLKATYPNDYEYPKEKHVELILYTLLGHSLETPPEKAFKMLSMRLFNSKWTIVLKTLAILHRGLHEAGKFFSEQLSCLKVSLDCFGDFSEKGSAHNEVIKGYFEYIKAASVSFCRENCFLELSKHEALTNIQKSSSEDLVDCLVLYNKQLKHIAKLTPYLMSSVSNYRLGLTEKVAYYLIRDTRKLLEYSNGLLEVILDRFATIDKPTSEAVVKEYSKFEKYSQKIEELSELSQKLPFATIKPPQVVKRPPEIYDSLQTNLQEKHFHSCMQLPNPFFSLKWLPPVNLTNFK